MYGSDLKDEASLSRIMENWPKKSLKLRKSCKDEEVD
jgi:hypothetical protein